MRAQTMYDRLNSITQRIPGLKLTQIPGGGYFISTELFYIEVLMDPSRTKVVEVKVAHNSDTARVCDVLTDVLKKNDLEIFARHLEGIASIYQSNIVREEKSRAYTALTALETDLSLLGEVQSTSINSCYNMLHRSPVGVLEQRKGGLPVKMTYFISPYDLVDISKKEMVNLTLSNIMDKNLGLSVTIGIEGSNALHTLQTTTLMKIIVRDGKSLPLPVAHSNSNSVALPAYFVMKLSKPMPISTSIINEIDQHIKIQQFSSGLTQESLINLIARQQLETSSVGPDDGPDFRKSVFCAKFLDQHHIYHVSGPHVDKFTGAIVTKIPFTHPTNIPSILKLLRQQALFNFIIGSCIRECRPFDSLMPPDENHKDVQILDINPISLTSICITFEHPSKESLATLEIDLGDINRNDIRCQLHALNVDTVCSDEFASKILQKCWSIPITMKSVIKKCLEKTEHLQEEIVRKREREMEELLKNNSQQNYPLNQSGRDSTSNSYFFDSVHGEILSGNLLFPNHQSTAMNNQNSTISVGTSGASFLAGLTDNLNRSNLSGSGTSHLNQSQYLKKLTCQPRAKADAQPSINNMRLSGLPNKTSSQSQTNIKIEGNSPMKKTSVSKQSNTMLMSMLSDIPAANTQSISNQVIHCNRPSGQNSSNQRILNLQRSLQGQSPNKQNSCHFPSLGNTNQKQQNDVDSGVVEKQKKTRKRKGGVDADGTHQTFGPRSPKSRKASDEAVNTISAVENNLSGVLKSTLPNIILPNRMDIKIKNDQSSQNNPSLSYISTQQNNPSKFTTMQDSSGSNLSPIIQRRENFENDSIKKEKKRKRAESTDNTKSASSTTPSSSSVGCQSSGSNVKVNAPGSQAQVKSGVQLNSGNAAKQRKSSINAVVDRLIGGVTQGPSTSCEAQVVGTSPSSSSSSGETLKTGVDHSVAGQNRVESSNKVGPSSTSSAKASKYSRAPADQFAIKQGSSGGGLKLTVTKTKPATPPSSSVPENVSKILNLGTTSSIKYTIPKLSKTQQAAQSSSSNLATSSDQGSSQTNSSDSNITTVASVLASTSASLPSSTTIVGPTRKTPAMSFRATGPGSMVRNPVSSSTHPANKSLLSSQTTVNTMLNRPSSSMQPDSINLQRISSSSNVGHPPQMLAQQGNRQNPRFNIPTPLGQNRFVTTIITPNVAPQFPTNNSSVLANQPEITTYTPNQSSMAIRPTNKFASTSNMDTNNITSSRSHISNHQSILSSTSSMVTFTPRAGVDSTQTSAIPRPSSGVGGPVQFYIRQSAFEETAQTSQTLPSSDHINAPRMVVSTISHPSIRNDLDSAMKSNISTFSTMPKPAGRALESFSADIADQSSQDDVSARNLRPTSIDDKMVESSARTAIGVTSSSDVSKVSISSTPSSPADCHQQIEVLPPPPLIPIDSLDDDQPPRDSIASSDNDASDRLSIVDINETVADSISSAGTPRPYSISEMTSPAGGEQAIQSLAMLDQSSLVSGSEQACFDENHDDGGCVEGTSEAVESNDLGHPESEASRDPNSCFLDEVQDEKSQQLSDNAYSMKHQNVNSSKVDSEFSSTIDQDQTDFLERDRLTDLKPESSMVKSAPSSSSDPCRTGDIQSQNKTLNALRGISSYNADSEGTSSSTEGTPTNKSPDQELDNDYCKVSNIIDTNVLGTTTEVDSFPNTTSTTESRIAYSSRPDQFENFSADRFHDNEHMNHPNQYVDSSEAQSASREFNNLSDQSTENIIKDSSDEIPIISSNVSTQSTNGLMDEISQLDTETLSLGLISNSDPNRISTNESDANVISAQSPSSV